VDVSRQCVLNHSWLLTQDSVLRKRESMELFQNSRNMQNDSSSTSKLLDERNSIMASIKSVNGVFRFVDDAI
jgi:hypothetical protein